MRPNTDTAESGDAIASVATFTDCTEGREASTVALAGHSSKGVARGYSPHVVSAGNGSSIVALPFRGWAGAVAMASGEGSRATAEGHGGIAMVGKLGSHARADGKRGLAVAGLNCTAAAGEDGTIAIAWWDRRTERVRIAWGVVGEDGIEAHVAYRVRDGALVPA